MSTAQPRKTGEELQDVELRPPLPPEHYSSDELHLAAKPVIVPQSTLCRMFVACHILEVGQETRFTALVLFHRYHFNAAAASTAETKGDQKMVAAACLFLACKIEDEPRRIRDVINVAHVLQFDKTDDNTEEKSKEKLLQTIQILPDPPQLDESYWKTKEQIVATEQAVLRMLQFDVLVSHPHRIVVLLAEEISSDPQLVAVAWRRLNDALFLSEALKCGSLPLACAALGLAIEETEGNANKKENVDGDKAGDLVKTLGLTKHWSQAYGVDEGSLENAKMNLLRLSLPRQE